MPRHVPGAPCGLGGSLLLHMSQYIYRLKFLFVSKIFFNFSLTLQHESLELTFHLPLFVLCQSLILFLLLCLLLSF